MTPAAATAGQSAATLRVGLLLDALVAPAWVHQAVSDLAASGDARLALAVVDASPPEPAAGRLARWWREKDALAYRLYRRADDALYARPDDAFAPRSLGHLLGEVPVLPVVPERGADCDRLDEADVGRIAKHDLDVLLRLGFRRVRGRALGVARHGVWSLRVGGEPGACEGAAGFREVAAAEPATAVAVVRLHEPGEGDTVLRRSWIATDPRSLRAGRSELAWKGAALLGCALRDLRRRGAAVPAAVPRGRQAAAERPSGAPGTAETLAAAARIGGRAARDRLLRVPFFEQWCLAYALDTASGETPRFSELLPPKDRLWADPFAFEHEGRLHVFFEECLAGSPRAHVSVMELAAGGGFTPPRTVLERPYHLSYPFVFAWDGAVWMIPETAENRTVELYRAERYPDRWTLDRVLLRGVRAADATLHEQGGRWWMFVAMAAPGARAFDDLHLFEAPSPLGPWSPAPGNPVVSDARCARPAGRPFLRDGRWIRPAQDGSGRYGRAVRFRRIERLDASGYAESDAGGIEPDWAPDVLGTHTFNTAGRLTVVDFIKRRRRLG